MEEGNNIGGSYKDDKGSGAGLCWRGTTAMLTCCGVVRIGGDDVGCLIIVVVVRCCCCCWCWTNP